MVMFLRLLLHCSLPYQGLETQKGKNFYFYREHLEILTVDFFSFKYLVLAAYLLCLDLIYATCDLSTNLLLLFDCSSTSHQIS